MLKPLLTDKIYIIRINNIVQLIQPLQTYSCVHACRTTLNMWRCRLADQTQYCPRYTFVGMTIFLFFLLSKPFETCFL